MKVAAIIYGTASLVVRRIYASDTTRELLNALHAGDGESFLLITAADVGMDENAVPDAATAQALVNAHERRVNDVGVCAVIDNATGDVVAVISADPAIDNVDGHTLFPDAGAFIGCTFDENGNAVAPATDDVT